MTEFQIKKIEDARLKAWEATHTALAMFKRANGNNQEAIRIFNSQEYKDLENAAESAWIKYSTCLVCAVEHRIYTPAQILIREAAYKAGAISEVEYCNPEGIVL